MSHIYMRVVESQMSHVTSNESRMSQHVAAGACVDPEIDSGFRVQGCT